MREVKVGMENGETDWRIAQPRERDESQIFRVPMDSFGNLGQSLRVIDEHVLMCSIPDLNKIAHDDEMIDISMAIIPFVENNDVITVVPCKEEVKERWRLEAGGESELKRCIQSYLNLALIDTTDREIYECLTCCYVENYEKGKGAVGTQLVGERAQIILDEVRDFKLFTRHECLEHIGEHFQPLMGGLENERPSVVGDAVIMNYLLVHLNKAHDKFNLLIFMVQKLFSLVDQTSVPDNPDSLQNHEVLLPGHLITIYLKEKLEEWLQRTKKLIEDEINKNKDYEFGNVARVKKLMDKNPAKQISLAVENMLETGRLNTPIWSRFAAEGRLDGSVREA
ncbi:hypothetical protein TB2_019766 [Malus domestica]